MRPAPCATGAADQAALAALADVRDAAAVDLALAQVGGDFDVIVNATGVVAFGAVHELPVEIVRALMATNAEGTLHLLRAASSVLRSGGVFVNYTGVAADMPVLGMSAYCASKAAARAAVQVAGREWRRSGRRVLDVRAPHTDTGLAQRALWGTPPAMPAGLAAAVVTERVVRALRDDEADLPATAFTGDASR